MKRPTKQQVWKWTKTATVLVWSVVIGLIGWHYMCVMAEAISERLHQATENAKTAPIETAERWPATYRRVKWDGHLWVEGNGMVSHHPECPCTNDTPEQ